MPKDDNCTPAGPKSKINQRKAYEARNKGFEVVPVDRKGPSHNKNAKSQRDRHPVFWPHHTALSLFANTYQFLSGHTSVF
jgi:hypothetical protein